MKQECSGFDTACCALEITAISYLHARSCRMWSINRRNSPVNLRLPDQRRLNITVLKLQLFVDIKAWQDLSSARESNEFRFPQFGVGLGSNNQSPLNSSLHFIFRYPDINPIYSKDGA